MAIDFPDSPTINDTFTVLGRTWKWNGESWKVVGSAIRGINLKISDAPPSDPAPAEGDMWYESDTGRTFTYYDSVWVELGNTASITTFLLDADADTRVHVEESADDDTIRFDTAGVERLTITSAGHVLPSADVSYDLGSSSFRFRDLYLSGSSIDLGGLSITSDGTNLSLPPISNVSGDFIVDTDTLAVDSTNNRVGIGTSTPTVPLDVVGDVTAATPSGDNFLRITFRADDTELRSEVSSSSSLDGQFAQIVAQDPVTESNVELGIVGNPVNIGGGPTNITGGDFAVDDDTLFVDASTNRVGIGTTSPSQKLHVDGNTYVTSGELFVNAGGNVKMNRAGSTTNTDAGGLEFQIDGTTYNRIYHNNSSSLGMNGDLFVGGGELGLTGTGNYPNSINFYHPTSGSGFWHQSGPRLLEGNRISWYWNDGSTYTEAMSMYPSGHMVKPGQPAFYAYISGSNPTYGAGWTSLVHNATLFNVGGTYNTTTKRFTCPTAGRWLFIVTVNYYNSDAGSRFIVHMDLNGAGFSRVWDSNRYTTTTQDNSFTCAVIMNLAVGNYVYPSFNSADTSWNMSAGTLYNSFQGYFLG